MGRPGDTREDWLLRRDQIIVAIGSVGLLGCLLGLLTGLVDGGDVAAFATISAGLLVAPITLRRDERAGGARD